MPDSPLFAIAYIIGRVCDLYSIIVLAAVILSWVRIDPSNPIVRLVRQVTEPPMQFIRKVVPFVVIGGLDLSPIVLLLGLRLLAQAFQRLAYSMA